MADIRISLTCADYARILPLATGEVTPEGIALTMILGRRGSWPARAEMLRLAVQDPEIMACNDTFTAAQKGFPYATPWLGRNSKTRRR